MDHELLIALCVFWISTTCALVKFLIVWFFNDGEAFHPHSVDIEHRHNFFLVVSGTTECKIDYALKSISAFVAPRGSSSSKNFALFSTVTAVSGFLGTSRWYAVGDANDLEAALAYAGFAALMLITCFELDVTPDTFLEEKVMVTGWLLERLKAEEVLPFSFTYRDPEFMDFLRSSKHIYPLYTEDHYILSRMKNNKHKRFNYSPIWGSLHMSGAIIFVFLVTSAIILNDLAEEKVAWITGALFLSFCLLGYLTGNYLPVIWPFKGWMLMWNPFVKDPHFMMKLQWSVEDYLRCHQEAEDRVIALEQQQQQQSNQCLSPLDKKTENTQKSQGIESQGSSSSSSSSVLSTVEKPLARVDVISIDQNHSTSAAMNDLDKSTVGMRKRKNKKHQPPLSPSLSCSSSSPLLDQELQSSMTTIQNQLLSPSNATSNSSSSIGLIENEMNFLSPSLPAISTSHANPHFSPSLLDPTSSAFLSLSQKINTLSLNNISLQFAHSSPLLYLKILSHVLLWMELIAMFTPIVAIGIQWVTALCDGPPVLALIELIWISIQCFFFRDGCDLLFNHHNHIGGNTGITSGIGTGTGTGYMPSNLNEMGGMNRMPHCILKK